MPSTGAKDISQEGLESLFKDGISEDLFRLFWTKDELNYAPSINIPDTIVYKYGQPVSWYFTALNGRVKKKNKHNLMSAKIEEVFNKHVLGYDVLAYFISIPTDADPNGATTIEYLNRSALNDFLYNNQKKDVSGILQRFIEPKTTHNEIIRAIWSPKVCLLERAENIHQLHDSRYGLYERCVIYEGPEYYFTSAPLRGPVLSGQIQKLCESVVDHISEVTFGQKQVSRIVLNLKVDSRDKIWLLYATSTRCIDMLEYVSPSDSVNKLQRTLVNIDSVISLSNTVHLNPNKTYEKIKTKDRIRCLSCAKESLEDMRHPVTYKSIIKHYDHVLHLLVENINGQKKESINWPPDAEVVEAAGGVGFGCLYMTENGDLLGKKELEHLFKVRYVKDLHIPCILHHVHPKLNTKSYFQCKKDPLFLYKTVYVCESCYLVYAEFTIMLLKMGQDLTKLLTPDPVAADLQSNSYSSLNRPSSADWRAISSTASVDRSKTAEFQPSYNHSHAKKSAIGLRSSDARKQPDLPRTVRTTSDTELANGSITSQEEHRSLQSREFARIRSAESVSSFGSSLNYDPEEVKAMIAERERQFFKEISLNPQLKDQHPLMHMISTQQKLKLVDEQSGVTKSKTANSKESIFGTKYGKQKDDKYDKYSAYGQEIPIVVKGEIILSSKLKEREKLAKEKERREKRILKSSFRFEAENDSIETDTIGSPGDNQVTKINVVTPAEVSQSIKASKKHNDFLADSLKKIEAEMEGV